MTCERQPGLWNEAKLARYTGVGLVRAPQQARKLSRERDKGGRKDLTGGIQIAATLEVPSILTESLDRPIVPMNMGQSSVDSMPLRY